MPPLHFIGKINAKAIIERDGKILIARDHHRDTWDFPGGRVHVGERPEEALVRELQEELGAAVIVRDLILAEQVEHVSDPAPHMFLTFRATLRDLGAPFTLPTEELEEAAWVDRESIKGYKLFLNCAGPLRKYFDCN